MDNKCKGSKSKYTKQDVMRLVEEEDVEFIRMQFTDMTGILRNAAITSCRLENALNNRYMFDCSAIEGVIGAKETDMYLYPDPDTLEIFPWRPQQGKVARLICDMYMSDGTNFEGDPRYILKKVISEAEDMGYTFYVGPECEFFLFNVDNNGEPDTNIREKAGYFDLGPTDTGENARRDMVLSLETMGFEIETSYHEAAPSQHEIDFKYAEALKAADNIMTFKLTVRSIARRHGLHASFMPKPIFGVNGSGMHINMSLSKDGVNIFDKPDGKLGLSDEAYYFMAGIMKHVRGMALLTNPLVNSYKRLRPESRSPVCIAWSSENNMSVIKMPKARGEGTRIELRSPDSSCNPYLAIAACLAAGLDGIKNRLECPESADISGTDQGDCLRMPRNLGEAIVCFEEDEFIKSVIGERVAQNYAELKKREWDIYTSQITEWELNEYLYRV